jgi:AcrR family transcriptional regulator
VGASRRAAGPRRTVAPRPTISSAGGTTESPLCPRRERPCEIQRRSLALSSTPARLGGPITHQRLSFQLFCQGSSEEYKELTRVALLEAATERFANDGYAATTIDAIASSARVSKGAVYYHFADKAELFEAAFRERQQQLLAKVAAAAASRNDPWDQLDTALAAYIEYTVADPTHRAAATGSAGDRRRPLPRDRRTTRPVRPARRAPQPEPDTRARNTTNRNARARALQQPLRSRHDRRRRPRHSPNPGHGRSDRKITFRRPRPRG